MSTRGALVLVVVAACLTGLAGCSSSTQLGDLSPSKDGNTPSDILAAPPDRPQGILGGLTGSDPKTGSVETTGSVATQPAEPGPSGEPVAPLAAPGLSGDDPHDDLQRGKRYFRTNNFGLAEKSFRAAVEKHPRDAEAWVDLAAAYDRLRRFDLADRAYAEAIRLIGPTPQILNDQGFSYMLRGDYARARKKLEEAQAKDPTNPYVRANLKLLEQSYREGKAVQ
jgi:tetratricopeptide (TPR) repeat protein